MADRAAHPIALTDEGLTVAIADGHVRGMQIEDAVTWRGIPFGAPISGPRRWLGPQTVQPWEGVRDATRFGAAPIQHLPSDAGREEHVGEHCLTVNVTRRAATREGLKPVLVFLYGGSNANGRSSYSLFGGLPLVEAEDIIFVTGNYRVGPFGFTDFSRYATPEHPIEGNLALRDQLGILRWVQENIEAFGGDPNDVTLAGQSAGALAVTTLMTVPAAKGLFHKAISMSSPVACLTSRERNDDRARRVVAQLGLDPVDPAPGLFSRPLLEIYDAAQAALASEQEHTPGMLSYASVVDGDLVPEFPLTVLAEGRAHPVPLLIGTVLNEGTLFSGVNAPTPPANQVRAMLSVTDTVPQTRITSAYPGYPALVAASALIGDFLFWAPSVQAAEGHATVAPVWMYRYDHGTSAGTGAHMLPTHGMDLPAVFGQHSLLSNVAHYFSTRSTLESVSRSTRHAWMDMVTRGSERWGRYSAEHRTTLVVDRTVHLEEDPHPERRAVWEGFGYYYDPTTDARARALLPEV